jgi:cysteine-rich repeat protein
MALAAARELHAAPPLLSPAGTTPALAGVARARSLALGRPALAELRGRRDAVLADFPLGADRRARLLLTRFDPFPPDARVDVVGRGAVRHPALPDHVYFVGGVAGEPRSRAFLVAAPDHVRGFVATEGTLYPFGPDGAGGHASWAQRDVDPAVYPAPELFCANDLAPHTLVSPTATSPVTPPAVGAVGFREAEVAVETDTELYAKFGSEAAALDYLAALVAAASAIYERDAGVRLRFSYIRLWPASDPWSATSPIATLDEVRAYWNDPSHGMAEIAGRRDLVHMISGKRVQGGVAYIDVLCDQSFGFGVSQVFGSPSPSQTWDLLVLAHELGHNFGSVHSHCYDPPLDRCYAQENGCYGGTVVPSQGSIMSYCHLLPGGIGNIDFGFGNVVGGVLRDRIARAACLASVGGQCGDGAVDAGEECDDGNAADGDGCSSTCRLPPRCGDRDLDPGEECDDGNTTGGDGCSAACTREPRCGDGTLDPGEGCDDRNQVEGDGCSAACQRERCRVLNPGQTLWRRARLAMQHRASGRDQLALGGSFALAVPVGGLAPGTTGVRLVIESAAGVPKLDLTLPPGARWTAKRGRWIYRDRAGAVGGIRSFILRDRTAGGLPEVEFALAGRGPWPLGGPDMPVAMTVVLGDAGAGEAGACGRHAFGGGSCVATRGGARLACR